MCQGASTGKRLEEGVRVLQQSGGCHAPGCPALGSEIALGLKRDQRGEDAKPSASFEAGSLWKGGKAARPSLTFQRGKGNSQDPRGVLGRNAEPTGTDGFRFLSHQFFPSSLHRLGNCISRSNRCLLMVKPLTPVLLRWVANGDQGQNTRNRVFPALPLSVVENSDFSPTRLTGQETRLLLASQELRMLLISSDEDCYVLSCVRVPAHRLPFSCGFRCFGIWTGSLFGLPPHKKVPSTAGSTGCSSRALHSIVRPVAIPPPSQQVRVHHPCPCVPGARSKAGEERAIRIPTSGFACPNRLCPYFGITDAQVHAPLWEWQAWSH